ncbi:MAG: fused MFS/spermidine synthase, partial [Acidimicrobiales bacterium]
MARDLKAPVAAGGEPAPRASTGPAGATGGSDLPGWARAVLVVLFAVTGFSALTLQVVWQRVISMHGGVDLFSITTVVASFLGGLGIGSLAGGALADRLGPRRSLVAFAAANAAIAAFAFASLWLFYDLYGALVPSLGGLGPSFAFHFALLIVPTTLMGLSLPLISRGVVAGAAEIAPMVGRLYATNTVGAAAGAAVSGWWMLGTLGFTATVRVAAALNLVAAALILTLWRA